MRAEKDFAEIHIATDLAVKYLKHITASFPTATHGVLKDRIDRWLTNHYLHSPLLWLTTELKRLWYSVAVINEQTMPR